MFTSWGEESARKFTREEVESILQTLSGDESYGQVLRSKGMVASILDDVPGLGPKRKKLLLKTFGSVKRMREATLEDIAAVPGIPRQVAEDLYAVILDANA